MNVKITSTPTSKIKLADDFCFKPQAHAIRYFSDQIASLQILSLYLFLLGLYALCTGSFQPLIIKFSYQFGVQQNKVLIYNNNNLLSNYLPVHCIIILQKNTRCIVYYYLKHATKFIAELTLKLGR